MSKIDTSTWEEFTIKSLFVIKRPTVRSQATYDEGNVPFVASGNYNNGVLKYLTPKENEELDRGNCITVSPVDGSAFYQSSDFLGRGGGGSSIILLYNDSINLYSGYFIATIIRTAFQKYYYGNMLSECTIADEVIKLPTKNDHIPDYEYMEQYMKEKEKSIISYLSSLKTLSENLSYSPVKSTKWKYFYIKEIFPNIIKPAVYHTRQVRKNTNGIPYVVRSKFNNGIKYQVDKPNGVTNPAKVISFGAENATFFYQKEEWISGRDIYYIDTRGINKYACLFITSCLQQITEKYPYNYGLFPNLLKAERIKLPVDCNGRPDYSYMETYMKQIEINTSKSLKIINTILSK